VALTTALFVIAAGQTRTQSQQGSAGRYQLLGAQYNWLGVDAEKKLVVDDKNQLFRIDTSTGETSILMFQPGANSQLQSFWLPVGK
jgi:hypothetical protein